MYRVPILCQINHVSAKRVTVVTPNPGHSDMSLTVDHANRFAAFHRHTLRQPTRNSTACELKPVSIFPV